MFTLNTISSRLIRQSRRYVAMSTPNMKTYTKNDVSHQLNNPNGVFTLPLSEAESAKLDYILYPATKNGTVMSITHVEVPSSFGGRGIAQILCDTAFDYAKNQQYKIFPQCPYVRNKYIPSLKENTQNSLVVNEDPHLTSSI